MAGILGRKFYINSRVEENIRRRRFFEKVLQRSFDFAKQEEVFSSDKTSTKATNDNNFCFGHLLVEI